MKRWLAFLSAVALLGTACGDGSSSQADSAPEDSTTTEAPSPPTTLYFTDLTLGPLRYRANWLEVTREGYRTEGVIQFGEPLRPDKTAEQFQAQLGACGVDEHEDAVIPALITLTNQTPNFSTVVRFGFYSDSAAAIVSLGGSPKCYSDGGDFYSPIAYSSTDRLGAGGMLQTRLYFIIRDYFTPNTPLGNRELLASCRVVFLYDRSEGEQPVTGDGAYNDLRGRGVFLAGTTEPLATPG